MTPQKDKCPQAHWLPTGEQAMEFFVGIALALAVCGGAHLLAMDRDRVFYPAMMIVIATYYVLFAVIDGDKQVLLSELAISAVFTVVALLGFKRNLWLLVAALAGHGVMDFFHHKLVHNSGVPQGWPGFCLTFDVTAAIFVACILTSRAEGLLAAESVPLTNQARPTSPGHRP
ncbi:hypothetical protein [Roseateles oligotrophus]|uniref:Uncharacterized protein n=1 Tax=Roseateles oligotrophus TaxID=1769250 RepID=A0ABT2Y9B2_9BURK|nr:hypothetical protein [Roseateles oligotrophus]MCV2366892.1 hypothetical protein [Roseateles oligotrophus]